ncbi:MAG: hypothetical protein KJI69_05120 [Patescibacteria group bacterium]|nr:hypothetical protein [Patescibacteria group bacterium]
MKCKRCKKEEKITKQIVWQYLLDHSRVTANGYLHIVLYMKDELDFFKRVRSRLSGYGRKEDNDEQMKIRVAENQMLLASKRNDFFQVSKHPIDRFVGKIQRLLNKYKRSRFAQSQEYAKVQTRKAKVDMRWNTKKQKKI